MVKNHDNCDYHLTTPAHSLWIRDCQHIFLALPVIPCITGLSSWLVSIGCYHRPGLLLFKNPAREDTAETIERLRSGDVRSVSWRPLGEVENTKKKLVMLRLVKFITSSGSKRGVYLWSKCLQQFWFSFIFWWFNSGEPQKELFPHCACLNPRTGSKVWSHYRVMATMAQWFPL